MATLNTPAPPSPATAKKPKAHVKITLPRPKDAPVEPKKVEVRMISRKPTEVRDI